MNANDTDTATARAAAIARRRQLRHARATARHPRRSAARLAALVWRLYRSNDRLETALWGYDGLDMDQEANLWNERLCILDHCREDAHFAWDEVRLALSERRRLCAMLRNEDGGERPTGRCSTCGSVFSWAGDCCCF